jgi:hypothetical protein
MMNLQWETTASPERDAASPAGDAVSPEGDLLASPNFGICDTTQKISCMYFSCTSFISTSEESAFTYGVDFILTVNNCFEIYYF